MRCMEFTPTTVTPSPFHVCVHCGAQNAGVHSAERIALIGQDGPACTPCVWSTFDHFYANAHDVDTDPPHAAMVIDIVRVLTGAAPLFS
jgi:hypothetical protein